jgi:hypothetical protein
MATALSEVVVTGNGAQRNSGESGKSSSRANADGGAEERRRADHAVASTRQVPVTLRRVVCPTP